MSTGSVPPSSFGIVPPPIPFFAPHGTELRKRLEPVEAVGWEGAEWDHLCKDVNGCLSVKRALNENLAICHLCGASRTWPLQEQRSEANDRLIEGLTMIWGYMNGFQQDKMKLYRQFIQEKDKEYADCVDELDYLSKQYVAEVEQHAENLFDEYEVQILKLEQEIEKVRRAKVKTREKKVRDRDVRMQRQIGKLQTQVVSEQRKIKYHERKHAADELWNRELRELAQREGRRVGDVEAEATKLQALVYEQQSKLATQQQALLDTNRALLSVQAEKDSALERSLRMASEAANQLNARTSLEQKSSKLQADLEKQIRARRIEGDFHVSRRRDAHDIALDHSRRNFHLEKEVADLKDQVLQQQTTLQAQHEALAETTKALRDAKLSKDSALSKAYVVMDEAARQLTNQRAQEASFHQAHSDARDAVPLLWRKGLGKQEIQRQEGDARSREQTLRVKVLEEEIARLHGVSSTQGKSLVEHQKRLQEAKAALEETNLEKESALSNTAQAIEHILATDQAEGQSAEKSRRQAALAVAAAFKKKQWEREVQQSGYERLTEKEESRMQDLEGEIAKLRFCVADQYDTITAQREALAGATT